MKKTNDMKNIFLGFLAQTLNKPAEEIAELLYQKGEDGKLSDELVENAAELLAGLDAERVKTLRATADNKKALEDQYKRGKKEALTDLEKALRSRYNLESDKTGEDLVSEIVAREAKSDLPDEKVKRHPLYLQLEKARAEEVKAIKEQYEAKQAELESGYRRKFTLSDVKSRALQELEKMNPVLPENPTVATKLKTVFANEFEQFDFEKQENGAYLILNGEKRLEDAHGNPVGFDKLVKDTAAQFFTFKEQGEKGSAGNKNGNEAGTGSITTPKTMEEAWEMARKAKTPEERAAILEAADKL